MVEAARSSLSASGRVASVVMDTDRVTYRVATVDDAPVLAGLNAQLIRDEGHRNRLELPGLTERMRAWLSGSYEALLFEADGSAVGYVLFRTERDVISIRQFIVRPERRRSGVGRAAIAWLRGNAWGEASRLRVDVLVANGSALAFWRPVGFEDYSVTMELEQEPGP